MLHAILLVAVWMGAFLLLVVIPFNFAMTPRLSRARTRPGRTPRVSVVIPARNEERQVLAAVRSHLAQDYPDFEVIAVDDRSTDRTGEILASLARTDPRLRVIAGVEPPSGWLGKPHALYQGACAASGELVLFADADVVYGRTTLAEAAAYAEERRVDLLALLPTMETRGFWESVLMPYILGAYFGGIGGLANVDRPRWFAAGAGAGNLVRRGAYDAVGGHAALKDSVVDDVHLAWKIKRAGFRARVVRAEDRMSVRMYDGFREVVDGFTKNIAYVINGVMGVGLVGMTAVMTVLWLAPPLVLAAALVGLAVPPGDVWLAAAACALVLAARLVVAAVLGDKVWPAATHPIMAAIWAFIIGRSLYQRLVRRRLVWRGREFDAGQARF